MSTMVHPMVIWWSLSTLNNFSSCKLLSYVEIITSRALDCKRIAYLRCFSKGFNTSLRGLIINGMFVISSVYDVSKGSSWLRLVLLLSWLTSQTINRTRSSSSSYSISLEVNMYSRGSENWLLSWTTLTVYSAMLTAKQSLVVFKYFMALMMPNTTYSSFTLAISSSMTTLIRVLPILRNGHHMMSETSLSSSILISKSHLRRWTCPPSLKYFQFLHLERCETCQLTVISQY